MLSKDKTDDGAHDCAPFLLFRGRSDEAVGIVEHCLAWEAVVSSDTWPFVCLRSVSCQLIDSRSRTQSLSQSRSDDRARHEERQDSDNRLGHHGLASEAALQEVDIYYFQAAIGSAEWRLLLLSSSFYESFLLDLSLASRAIGPGACRRNIAGAVAG